MFLHFVDKNICKFLLLVATWEHVTHNNPPNTILKNSTNIAKCYCITLAIFLYKSMFIVIICIVIRYYEY